MIGRVTETQILSKTLTKKNSSFIAITGRRRVGKTYLIDNFYKKQICFRMTGIQNVSIQNQLKNFNTKLAEYQRPPYIDTPGNWQEAFQQLKTYLQTLDRRTKKVVFFDELPWMATARTNFLSHLGHLWNDYLSKENHFILVVCGSATSWITQHIVNETGGLHNRLTDQINLQPFTLLETKQFLTSLHIKLTHQEITKLFMTFGGVPYYLEQIKKGEGATTAVERICFSNQGALRNEYDNLYRALFKNAANHESIVSILAKKTYGLTREEILKASKVTSGGPYNRAMQELILSGFVTPYVPFGRTKRGSIYRLNDEFSIFYHQFMKPNKKHTSGMWLQISASQSYKIWSGFAFEGICLKHIDNIKKSLGISGVYTKSYSFKFTGNKYTKGFQIDLVLDRKDGIINLCEIKYYASVFKIDKKYANHLTERRQEFINQTQTKKQVFNTIITNHGLFQNEYSLDVIDSMIELDDLFA